MVENPTFTRMVPHNFSTKGIPQTAERSAAIIPVDIS
jgi:hypothetical protein